MPKTWRLQKGKPAAKKRTFKIISNIIKGKWWGNKARQRERAAKKGGKALYMSGLAARYKIRKAEDYWNLFHRLATKRILDSLGIVGRRRKKLDKIISETIKKQKDLGEKNRFGPQLYKDEQQMRELDSQLGKIMKEKEKQEFFYLLNEFKEDESIAYDLRKGLQGKEERKNAFRRLKKELGLTRQQMAAFAEKAQWN